MGSARQLQIPGVRASELLPWRKRELAQRDRALDKHDELRAELLGIADRLAREIAMRDGSVTSVAVLVALRDRGFAPLLADVDPRFIGAVFRRAGWRRLRWEPIGSHGRPVPVWALDSENET